MDRRIDGIVRVSWLVLVVQMELTGVRGQPAVDLHVLLGSERRGVGVGDVRKSRHAGEFHAGLIERKFAIKMRQVLPPS